MSVSRVGAGNWGWVAHAAAPSGGNASPPAQPRARRCSKQTRERATQAPRHQGHAIRPKVRMAPRHRRQGRDLRCQTRPRPVLGGGSAGDTGRHITRPAGTSECALVCARVCEWMCGRPHREPRTLKYLVRYYLWSRIPFGFKKASLEIEKKELGYKCRPRGTGGLVRRTAGCICHGVPCQTRVG